MLLWYGAAFSGIVPRLMVADKVNNET